MGGGQLVERLDQNREVLPRFDGADRHHVLLSPGQAPAGGGVGSGPVVERGEAVADGHHPCRIDGERGPHLLGDELAHRVDPRPALEGPADERRVRPGVGGAQLGEPQRGEVVHRNDLGGPPSGWRHEVRTVHHVAPAGEPLDRKPAIASPQGPGQPHLHRVAHQLCARRGHLGQPAPAPPAHREHPQVDVSPAGQAAPDGRCELSDAGAGVEQRGGVESDGEGDQRIGSAPLVAFGRSSPDAGARRREVGGSGGMVALLPLSAVRPGQSSLWDGAPVTTVGAVGHRASPRPPVPAHRSRDRHGRRRPAAPPEPSAVDPEPGSVRRPNGPTTGCSDAVAAARAAEPVGGGGGVDLRRLPLPDLERQPRCRSTTRSGDANLIASMVRRSPNAAGTSRTRGSARRSASSSTTSPTAARRSSSSPSSSSRCS